MLMTTALAPNGTLRASSASAARLWRSYSNGGERRERWRHGRMPAVVSLAVMRPLALVRQWVWEHSNATEGAAWLIVLRCSAPPDGHARWTLRRLADQAVALELVAAISHETVRQVLKKMR